MASLRVKYILFGFQTSTKYEYYSGWANHVKTNTNIFGFEKSSEYKYTNNIRFENICRIRIRISLFGLNYLNTELFAHLWLDLLGPINNTSKCKKHTSYDCSCLLFHGVFLLLLFMSTFGLTARDLPPTPKTQFSWLKE